ncbi:MAG: NADH:ubiquinone reductase (Na(+)-transporting) subunit B [Tunicatimonas sp.]|uniref:NADH:ubiquinone reductase (Na(+)-transporting) subunit B n=1 Tax=Tunicatimonas sp. TaxID=1940096 RepID=UPI003C74867E
MNVLRKLLDQQKPLFEKGGKLEKFYYAFEAGDTFLFTPNTTGSKRGTHIHDAIDLKRMMITVVIAMVPALLFGIYNVGHTHFLAVGELAEATFLDKVLIGSIAVLPIVIVSYAAGGLVEVIFATIRRHPINEGFLVTGMLIALIMPPTLPLWQVALAAIFAVVIAKEVFGGTGMNVLNVAMTARAFLYFAYPGDMSGDVWYYLGDKEYADGFSGATPLGLAAETVQVDGVQTVAASLAEFQDGLFTFWNMAVGLIPGSIGSTSFIAVMIGAVIIIATGVGSWKTILSGFIGVYVMQLILNIFGSNEYMNMPPHYHFVMGGVAFGIVFMATDPVSSAHTEWGKWIYGFLIGVITVIIRVLNPAYPEGIMLAVLFMNVFAPLIDFYVVEANKKRRLQRATV